MAIETGTIEPAGDHEGAAGVEEVPEDYVWHSRTSWVRLSVRYRQPRTAKEIIDAALR